MSYIVSLLIAAGIGSAKASGQGTEPGFGEAQPTALPPVIVNFQGHLRQGTTIINGTYSMTFRLYNAASGGTLLQTMGPWNVNVSSGVFNVELPITRDNILNYTDLWVEVEIPALGGIYSPRVKINAAAFAYNAYMADTAQNFMDNALQPQDLLMRAAGPNQWNDFDLDDNGRIDLALLDVPASGTDPGYIWNQDAVMQNPGRFWIQRQSTVGNPADTSAGGIFAQLRPESGGSPFAAFWGQRGTANGYGAIAGGFYGGYFLSRTQAGNVGVYAWCDAEKGEGVYAVGNTATSFGVFAYGNVAGATGVVAGGNATDSIYYIAGSGVSGASSNVGIYGRNSLNASSNGFGVQGVTTNSSKYVAPNIYVTAGVYGRASRDTTLGVWGRNCDSASIWIGDRVGVQGNGDSLGGSFIGQPANSVGLFAVGSIATVTPTNYIMAIGSGVSGVGEGTGVYGRPDVAQSSANEVYGVLGAYNWVTINGIPQWVGVFGYENDNSTGGANDNSWAGLFYGDVYVLDNIDIRSLSYHTKGDGGKGHDLIATSPKTVYNDVMISGTVNLSGGQARVRLDSDFLAMVDPASMRVTATAIGAPVTVYVAEITSDGFVLKSVDGQSCRVDWIVMAYQAGVQAKIDQSKAGAMFATGLGDSASQLKVTKASTAADNDGIKVTDQAPADPKKEVR